jgi:K+-sensing histidine kinase KdpD
MVASSFNSSSSSSYSPLALEISVIDSGTGIPPKQLNGLFQEIMKKRSEGDQQLAAMNSQGVGLGLPLSNMLVRQLEPGDDFHVLRGI